MIKQAHELINKEFLLLEDQGHYSSYVNVMCTITRHPVSKQLEIFEIGDYTQCYELQEHSLINHYTIEENPEYFL